VGRDSDVESSYSVDLFSQRVGKVDNTQENTSPPPARAPSSVNKESSPSGRRSAGQRNILDYVKKRPRLSEKSHEVSPSGSDADDTKEKVVVETKSSPGEKKDSFETWFREIKEKVIFWFFFLFWCFCVKHC
jgi:hypothetical protein